MLKIFRGHLDLAYPEVTHKIHNKIRRKPLKLELREIKKFIYFLENPTEIFNPVTMMIVNGEILHIHPGNFRLQAAYFRNEKYIDCIFVITDDEKSLEKVSSISKDTTPVNSISLYKNGFGDWWEINTLEHKEMSNDTVSRKVFDRTLDQSFEKFKEKNTNFKWRNFYENSSSKVEFDFEDREGCFQSICYALGRDYPGETKFKIKKL